MKRDSRGKYEEPIVLKITPFGVYAFQENRLIKTQQWGKTPQTCAVKYFEKEKWSKELSSSINVKTKRLTEGLFGEELEKFALAHGFKQDEWRKFFQQFMVELTKIKLKEGLSVDRLIMQAVLEYDDLNKIINMLYERVREWYGLYWPEAVKKANSVEDLVKIMERGRNEQSMGFDLEEKDIAIIRTVAAEIKQLTALREKVTSYTESLMKEAAPNIAGVAGSLLGAKIIQLAGGLKRLANMPSSTVQVLGAEKALFRHIRRGTKPPKHGIILSHQLMAKTPREGRGKVARKIASKIAIAAKIDFYSKGKDIRWKELVKGLEAD